MSNDTAELEVPAPILTYEEEREKPMPSANHGAIQANLIIEFAQHRQYRIYSELALEIGDRFYVPDLSLYHRAALDLRHDTIRRTDPPLLVVEILSPTQGYQEVLDKVAVYFQHGIKSCWMVWPPLRQVTILTPDGSQYPFTEGTITDPIIGITADLTTVFS